MKAAGGDEHLLASIVVIRLVELWKKEKFKLETHMINVHCSKWWCRLECSVRIFQAIILFFRLVFSFVASFVIDRRRADVRVRNGFRLPNVIRY